MMRPHSKAYIVLYLGFGCIAVIVTHFIARPPRESPARPAVPSCALRKPAAGETEAVALGSPSERPAIGSERLTPTAEHFERLLQARICVESGGDPRAYNKAEHAAGLIQIRPILIRDVNRILHAPVFGLNDRYDPAACREIHRIWLTYYGVLHELQTGEPATTEVLARLWPGGPDGARQACTLDYWQRLRAAMKETGQ